MYPNPDSLIEYPLSYWTLWWTGALLKWWICPCVGSDCRLCWDTHASLLLFI